MLEVEVKSIDEKSSIFRLLDTLGLHRSTLIRRSYLELIMEKGDKL